MRAERILVVGGTGQIGQAVIQALGDRTWIGSAGPDGADIILDLFDGASILSALEQAGPLDAIVCAAGPGGIAPLAGINVGSTPDPTLAMSIKGKLMGQINLALAAMRSLKDGGSITLITGVTATQPVPLFSSLAAANAGIEGFVRAAAIEMPRGLRINAVSPGVLAGSPEPVLAMFAGHEPVEISDVAKAFVAAIDGQQTGTILNIN